jgi:hypothetical protein
MTSIFFKEKEKTHFYIHKALLARNQKFGDGNDARELE